MTEKINNEKLNSQLEEKFEEFMQEYDSEEYSFHDEKDFCKVFMKTIKNQSPYWKSVSYANCPAEFALSLLTKDDKEERMIWDTACVDSKVVLKLDEDNVRRILWTEFKTPMMISNRDFLYQRSYKVLNDSYLLVCHSIDEEDFQYKNSSCQRGLLHLGGMYIEKIGNDKCKITQILKSDAKGWLPHWVTFSAQFNQSLCPGRFSKFCEKLYNKE
jgi:predicted nuclease of predicted toxin-antitoxin system